MNPDWNWPGSRWWRVDLHTHSPASYDFGKQQDRKSPDWAKWVQAVQDADLDSVALTDHNTAVGLDPIKAAAHALDHGPTVFPGVELTAGCGTHILVILDPASTHEHVADFLSQAGIPPEQRGSSEARSQMSVEQILELAAQRPPVFIAAHGNGPAGLLEHDGLQRIQELKHPNLAAVELVSDPDFDETWIDGSRPKIGRRLPRVWCSDAHQFEDLGRRFTWVKMTRPDLEGLRLALLDGDESSLRPATKAKPGDPNRHAHQVIESITVDKAKHMGRPDSFQVRFNPWLTTIIGGRGTGKSTLIDFCRQTLRREAELEGSSLSESFKRRLSIPRSKNDEGLVTEETRLEIVYRKDGDRFRILWKRGSSSPAIQRWGGEDWHPEEGKVHERFPVRIYSQKQLFELAQDPVSLLRVIDDSQSVNGPQWQRKIQETEERYLAIRADERAARSKLADLPNRRAALADVKRKLDAIQQSGGAEALASYRQRSQRNGTWRSIVADALERIDALARAAEDLTVADLDLGDAVKGDPALEALQRMHDRLRKTVQGLQNAVSPEIERARLSVDSLKSDEDVDVRVWMEACARSHAESEAAAAKLEESGISSPDEYRALVSQASELAQEIEKLEAEVGRAEALGKEAGDVLAEQRRHFDSWSKLRAKFADEASSERLCVAVKARASLDLDAVVAALRSRLGIERFDKDFEALAERLLPEGEPWSWGRLDALVRELRGLCEGDEKSASFCGRRFCDAVKKLHPERIDRLALYAPEDAVDVKFRDAPGGSWSSLAKGSPGQQTAALLAFVLGYGEEPILLDQPEDDLDNRLIYKVLVQRLKEIKTTRQVILVTHNPNIVVHGDAELVLSLEARCGQTHVKSQGGLQEQAVRDEICRVMEGGEDAFKERYRRIVPVGENPR
ncbi:MAG: hypothetical protein CSA62_11855 [Planctomycetota bacterium]|nr:MAG: hypothetical protein CSA62_11855 [Planctomycetota bacterium]